MERGTPRGQEGNACVRTAAWAVPAGEPGVTCGSGGVCGAVLEAKNLVAVTAYISFTILMYFCQHTNLHYNPSQKYLLHLRELLYIGYHIQ